jgi:hypothetical protein
MRILTMWVTQRQQGWGGIWGRNKKKKEKGGEFEGKEE